jgi:hypothetical protein
MLFGPCILCMNITIRFRCFEICFESLFLANDYEMHDLSEIFVRRFFHLFRKLR